MGKADLVIGVDFGTGSVRSLLSDAKNGQQLASAESFFPRWKKGLYCDASKNQFRQHPLDHLEAFKTVLHDLLQNINQEQKSRIRAISIDTTGSTPVAVDQTGQPLALRPEFSENPMAMFFMWKDHTAIQEAADINQHATHFKEDYLKYVGGIYSSEWYWSKLLFVLRSDPEVRKACYSWVEHSDWMPFLLTGGTDVSQMIRNVCAAGHKALWAAEFGGFPPNDFFASLDPLLDSFSTRLPKETFSAAEIAGNLSPQWAGELGLSTEVLVGVGALDAHFGAVGGQIEPYYMSKVMGTSTCDMIVAPLEEMEDILVRGISGQVNGSIIPRMLGMEAGQSAFGDIYAWFRDLLSWPLKHLLSEVESLNGDQANELAKKVETKILISLSEAAKKLPLREDAELAVDWLNGRRTPDANHLMTGAIQGLTLGSKAPAIFRSLVEATCFGSRRIIERFMEEGVPVKGIIAVGGVAKKSDFVIQMMADVLGMAIKVHKSEQTTALGAAMFAATVAGLYPKVEQAMHAMGQGFEKEFVPDTARHLVYSRRYEQYKEFSDFLEKAGRQPEQTI